MDNNNSNTINKRLQIIADLQRDINVLKEQLSEALEQDPQYLEVKEKSKAAREETKEKKAAVMEKSSYKALQEEIKEINQEIKDNKEVLSHELVEYYRQTGSLEIEDEEGNVKKLKFSVKLVN